MSEIKTGDIVYLKSGSPAMTVNGASPVKGLWVCAWFTGTENKAASFTAEALTTKNPKSKVRPMTGG